MNEPKDECMWKRHTTPYHRRRFNSVQRIYKRTKLTLLRMAYASGVWRWSKAAIKHVPGTRPVRAARVITHTRHTYTRLQRRDVQYRHTSHIVGIHCTPCAPSPRCSPIPLQHPTLLLPLDMPLDVLPPLIVDARRPIYTASEYLSITSCLR